MQRRRLGQTELELSILGFGGYHLLEIPASKAASLLHSYLDAGGNYIETAASYGDGESELRIGPVAAERRDEFYLATKTGERDAEGVRNEFARSLSNLQTDYVDILFLHAVGTNEDLERVLAPGGALCAAEQLCKEGKVRYIGITMHGQPDVLIEAVQRYPFDVLMTGFNYFDRFNFPRKEKILLPLCQERGVGVMGMKPVADGLLHRSAKEAFRYAWTLPLATVVAGINTGELLELDLQLAEDFTPMGEEKQEQLFAEADELGTYVCRLCGECLPCPENINIPEVFKLEGWYDRQLRDGRVRNAADYSMRERLRFWFGNRERAQREYECLHPQAEACTDCGECVEACPYGLDIPEKLRIADYKLSPETRLF